ncbi:MAG: tyrosine--tRNA ligase [Planctomycetota bacterium]|jgi:tyrosyl-tRNA synthetase|nr:tyrosine--tRNA ligase [Planctomycetota bacterium]
MNALEELSRRGVVNAVSDPALGEVFARERVSFYCGYDPSFSSLQLGNLFAIVTMRRLQELGHRPVILVGGGTGCIGDPSGRGSERNLLDRERVEENARAIRRQLEGLIDFGGGAGAAVLVDNRDWLAGFNLLDFLREVGSRFRVGEMLARDSVKRRLESEDGLSFTEFSYQVLQAYDFLHLYRMLGVRLQIGGGDQWGNITAGIDLIRREESAQAFGLVIPLVTDSQGRKFGKSTAGEAIYLDAGISSPYRMYQFLLNAEDVRVVDYLKYYTFLPLEEIAVLEAETRARPERREAQRRLAGEVVKFVHGADGLARAEKATAIFFGAAIENLSYPDLRSIFSGAPRVELARDRLAAGINVVELLAATPLWKGKNDVRRSIEQRGAYLNNLPVETAGLIVDSSRLVAGGALVVRKGKKNYALILAADF